MVNKKKWYKSRSTWGALIVIFGGVATAVGKFLQGELDIGMMLNTVIPMFGVGLGIIGIRFAKK